MPSCTENSISRLPFGSQKNFTTNFSPEIHRKKAQQSISYENLRKRIKTPTMGDCLFIPPKLFTFKCTNIALNFTESLPL